MNTIIEKKPWKTTDKRFVAFLDILGFKELILRASHEEIYLLLKEISKTKKLVEKAAFHDKVGKQLGDVDIYIVSFSDSIIVFSKNDDLANFQYFLLSVRWLISGAISKKIPLKGALAHGEISLNKSEQIYFGQPIIDSYLLEEDLNYLGVIAHHSIDNYINTKRKVESVRSIENMLFEEKTPLKSGIITHTNLNWFKIFEKGNISELKNRIKEFKNTSSGSPRRYVDNTLSVIEKYESLMNVNY